MYIDVALANFSKATLTYSIDQKTSIIGHRVKVPFGKQFKIGIVIDQFTTTSLSVDIKPIQKVLDTEPLLDQEHIVFLKNLANYYQISLNEIILSAIPNLALKETSITDLRFYTDKKNIHSFHHLLCETREDILIKKIRQGILLPTQKPNKQLYYSPSLSSLSSKQQEIVNNIQPITLLWGETGCGKTEIYTHLINQALRNNKQVLCLVPEISLTEQMIAKIKKRLGIAPVVIHSLQTPKKRLCHFLKAKHGDAFIILGTRSALLCPIKNLGLIIVDEEHDSAYRQEHPLFFSAKDAAILKANQLKIPIILGSATPSLESLYNAKKGKYHLALLFERYQSTQPKMHLVPMKKHTFISPLLVPIVEKTLNNNNHVMLYIGKRGYSRLIKCHHCGYDVRCQSCDRVLVLHKNQSLHCHHCDLQTPLLVDCPACKMAELSHYGAGSQQIESIAQTLWPNHPVIRVDTDTMSASHASKTLMSLHQAKATLIVGTQMLTKGHDIERLNTVVVINADHGLYAPDFRAEEKLYAELIQVSGRSGRRKEQGHVYIQTEKPAHPLFKGLTAPKQYYEYLLEQRAAFVLPPYTYIGCLFIRGNPTQIQRLLSLSLPQYPSVSIQGPSIFPQGKKKQQDCYHIMVSSQQRVLRNNAFFKLHSWLKERLSTSTFITQIDSHLSL